MKDTPQKEPERALEWQRRVRQTRRVSASPRIQELANRFEQAAQDVQTSRPSGSNAQVVAINLSMGDPISSQHFQKSHLKPAAPTISLARRPLDGLPNTGQASMPTFPSTSSPKRTLERPSSEEAATSRRSVFFNPSTSLSDSRDESATLNEDHRLLSETYSDSCHTPESLPSSSSSCVKPYPAHQVFAPDAFPLYLPHLDEYLTSDNIFNPPSFSDARLLCSEEEIQLYGYSYGQDFTRAGLEVCGAQLKIPVQAMQTTKTARQRKKGTPKSLEGDNSFEVDVLCKDSPPVSSPLEEEKSWLAKSTAHTSSSMSTASRPKSRLDKFPPLMLLEQNSLDELKSNAIGPRKPPGGFIGYFSQVGATLGIVVDFVIGVEGSTLAAGIFRLQLFMDFVQLTNLNSLFAKSAPTEYNKVNTFLLFTLPSFLALDFVNVFGFAIIIFMAFTVVVGVLLFLFWRMTVMYNPNRNIEGYNSQPWLFHPFLTSKKVKSSLDKPSGIQPWRSTPWTKFKNILIVVLLTILYIPVGKLSLDAVVWNSDYWPEDLANQYASDPSIWRNPIDVCYTTTMRKDEFNWAYVIVTMAAFTLISFTLWFPFQMRRTILTLLPRVPEYNELGHKRSKDDLSAEYIRLLQQDSSPLSFLYQAYKRDWGNYKPLYLLFFKFSNMFVISVFAQDNCLWRNFDANKMLVAQQTILIIMQGILLIVHLLARPFIDQISNRSELVSRTGYVIDDVVGLLVAVHVKDAHIYNTWILYIVYAFTYSANIYFALANTALFSHWVKKIQKRIDFSIDIFSPFLRLDMHIKRRIWQETISTILLTGREFHMPLAQLVTFMVLPEDCPSYLLSFQGTATERHVENLKIVKQIGMDRYRNSVNELRGKDSHRWQRVIKDIQIYHTGPDAYWKPIDMNINPKKVSSYFGKAFLIPFPPTLAIQYDQVPEDEDIVTKLTTLYEFEMFLWQNSSEIIQRRKLVRAKLRALDGEKVYCPYIQAVEYGTGRWNLLATSANNAIGGTKYSLVKPVFYSEGILKVLKKTSALQDGYNFQSGFDVSICYDFGIRRDAEGESLVRNKVSVEASAAFGLRDDFEWTNTVQRFFHANRDVIDFRLSSIQVLLEEYRIAYYMEAKEKGKTMDYSFLIDVFDCPVRGEDEVRRLFGQGAYCKSIRHLPRRYPATMKLLLERLNVLARSPVHRWWHLFWDDLWRQNSADFKPLQRQKRIFCPQFPTSIAWTPLTRNKLEELLKSKSGLWSDSKRKMAIFTPGFLNQIYFTMEELAFHHGQNQSHTFPMELGVANKNGTIQKATVSLLSPNQSSRVTGGGTDHNDSAIFDRNEWAWTEQRLSGAPSKGIWQAFRRFLTLNRYTPNQGVQEVWIYARLTDAGTGKWRYEAEKRTAAKSKRGVLSPCAAKM